MGVPVGVLADRTKRTGHEFQQLKQPVVFRPSYHFKEEPPIRRGASSIYSLVWVETV